MYRSRVVLVVLLRLFPFIQNQCRCESILRSRPDSRLGSELHLAATEAQERDDEAKVKKAAAIGAVAVAAVGVLGVVAGALLSKR
jgi:hypothetical protein